jgi:GTP cyclohydrolase I
MKQTVTPLTLLEKDFEHIEEIGDNHASLNLETPLREDAFEMSDVDKIKKIAHHFSEIMQTMGLDLSDDSLSGTPLRVAKMYVKEVFSGLDPKNKPTVKLFENKYGYKEMLVERDITVHSFCEHHFVPIIGKAHIAYLNNGQVVGLSKLNRIVDYFSRRPQVQERLTVQIANELKQLLHTEDIAVILDAKHMCVSIRGVEDVASSTLTASYHGAFQQKEVKEEFLQYVYGKK